MENGLKSLDVQMFRISRLNESDFYLPGLSELNTNDFHESFRSLLRFGIFFSFWVLKLSLQITFHDSWSFNASFSGSRETRQTWANSAIWRFFHDCDKERDVGLLDRSGFLWIIPNWLFGGLKIQTASIPDVRQRKSWSLLLATRLDMGAGWLYTYIHIHIIYIYICLYLVNLMVHSSKGQTWGTIFCKWYSGDTPAIQKHLATCQIPPATPVALWLCHETPPTPSSSPARFSPANPEKKGFVKKEIGGKKVLHTLCHE